MTERNHPGVRFRLEIEGTGNAPRSVVEDMLMRAVCHVIIERLPTEAVVDVWESVHGAWERHSRPPRPATPAYVVAGPSVRVGSLVVEEPPFRIVEE